jgi:hypothetical protein
MNVDFNFRANHQFVVTCKTHGEVDRAASQVAAEILAGNHNIIETATTDTCHAAKGCKYEVAKDFSK